VGGVVLFETEKDPKRLRVKVWDLVSQAEKLASTADAYLFFSSSGPNLRDAEQIKNMIRFFGLNWRKIFLFSVYMLISVALLIFALRWVNPRLVDWDQVTVAGWGFVLLPVGIFGIVIWRLMVEEMPRLAYHKEWRVFSEFELTTARVVSFSFPIAGGGPLGSRRVIWEDRSKGLNGKSPFLPGHLIHRLEVGSELWIIFDPRKRFSPLVVGAKSR
jgi:hypothetical protein